MQAVLAGAVASGSALTLAMAPAALAAQEAFMVAEVCTAPVSYSPSSCSHALSGVLTAYIRCAYALQGEPLVVQLGWAALAASFSASLAFVVWGRSGL